MKSLQNTISNIVSTAFASCGFSAELGAVSVSERQDLSQFQNTGALKGAKLHSQAPRAIAEAVAAKLREDATFKEVTVDGPGFLNFKLSDEVLASLTAQAAEQPVIELSPERKKVVIDFGGPNVAKPLHVGHLRSSIIGDSLQRLLRAQGHEVYGDIHLGDWGTPMGVLIAILRQEQPSLPYFDADFSGPYPEKSPVSMEELERLYPAGSNLLKADEAFKAEALQATAELQAGRPGYRALWKHFIEVSEVGLKQNFDALGVTFDWWYGESHYHDRIAPLVEKLRGEGHAVESNGALIIPLPDAKGKEVPPLMLLKSDGAFLYGTTDLACIDERVNDDKADWLIYVVDQRQSLHFDQVFAAAHKTGLVPKDFPVVHAGFGTMNGTDGKPFKTRAGGVMKLKDLIEMVTTKAAERMEEAGLSKDYPEAERTDIAKKVGIAALKFADLINNRASNYIFDLDRFVSFEGKTGPYLVYTAVRIRSILRKLELDASARHPLLPATDIERPLMLALGRLPEAIDQTVEGLSPHTLAEYAFELAQEFNRFYQNTNIVNETDRAKKESWIALSTFTLRQLEATLGILGMEIPERM